MGRRLHLNKIAVVDIEATCWDSEHGEKIPEGQESEIIEIGIAILNMANGEVDRLESYIVKPIKSKVSKFCTDLTTLTQEQVDQGITFERAIKNMINDVRTKKMVWASFGEYDKKMFVKQCKEREVEYPFSPHHLNVKTLFALKKQLVKMIGTGGALRELGLQFEGTQHRGVDDAKNIAKILWDILK